MPHNLRADLTFWLSKYSGGHTEVTVLFQVVLMGKITVKMTIKFN